LRNRRAVAGNAILVSLARHRAPTIQQARAVCVVRVTVTCGVTTLLEHLSLTTAKRIKNEEWIVQRLVKKLAITKSRFEILTLMLSSAQPVPKVPAACLKTM
jgi:hypothetical protein